jgi:hypothetical protein
VANACVSFSRSSQAWFSLSRKLRACAAPATAQLFLTASNSNGLLGVRCGRFRQVGQSAFSPRRIGTREAVAAGYAEPLRLPGFLPKIAAHAATLHRRRGEVLSVGGVGSRARRPGAERGWLVAKIPGSPGHWRHPRSRRGFQRSFRFDQKYGVETAQVGEIQASGCGSAVSQLLTNCKAGRIKGDRMSQVAAVGVQKDAQQGGSWHCATGEESQFRARWYSVMGGAVAVIEGVRQRWVSRRVWVLRRGCPADELN